MTATVPDRTRTADRRVLAWVLLGQSTTYVALAAVVAVLLPALLADLDPAGKERSLAVVSFLSSAVTAVTLPLVGALSDRTRSPWGRRAPWAVVGGVTGGIAVALLPSATTVVALGALWVAAQVALNLVDGAVGAAVADDVTAPRRGTGAGVLALGAGLGSGGGAVGTGQLVGSPALAAVLAGAVAAGGAVLFLVLARRVRPATWTDRSTPGPDGEPTGAGSAPGVGAGRPSALRRALGRPALRRALLTRALVVGGAHMITAYQLYVLVEWAGLSVEEAGRVSGVLVVVHTLSFTAASVVGGRWSDAVGRRRPFLVAAPLALAAAALLPLLLPAAPAVVGYAVLAGLATGTFFTVQLADTVDRLPSLDDAGHDLGLLGTATTLPQAVSPLLGYAAYEVLGGYGGVFALVAALAVIAAVVSVGGRRHPRR